MEKNVLLLMLAIIMPFSVMAWDGKDLKKLNNSGNCIACNLSNLDLYGVNLSNSNLSGTDLSGSNLRNTNLSRTNLGGSNLNNANLSGADLSSSNLKDVTLANAKLSMANLANANLSNAYLGQKVTQMFLCVKFQTRQEWMLL